MAPKAELDSADTVASSSTMSAKVDANTSALQGVASSIVDEEQSASILSGGIDITDSGAQ